MPVQPCQSDGKPGYRWGDTGRCFTYERGDEDGRERARQKAVRQGAAISYSRQKSAGTTPDTLVKGR